MMIPSREILIAAFGACVALSASDTARAQSTGLELFQYCTALEKGMRTLGDERVSLGSDLNAHVCWGVINALHALAYFTDDSGRRILGACPAKEVTNVQTVYVFNKYARAHPEQLHKAATFVALSALQEAFPCGSAR